MLKKQYYITAFKICIVCLLTQDKHVQTSLPVNSFITSICFTSFVNKIRICHLVSLTFKYDIRLQDSLLVVDIF